MRLRPPHVPSLDMLRGVLALAVAVYHFQSWTRVFGSHTSASNTVAVLGIYAVQGFFIISGFCFFHLYAGTHFGGAQLKAFYLKRFLRLAPLYYLALALNVLLDQPVGPMTWQRVVENLTLSFGLFHPNHARVLGGWSIGIEVVFYLAFPWLAWLLRTRAALYAATVALMGVALLHASKLTISDSQWVRFDAYVELPNHAFLFLLGGVVADLMRSTRSRLPTWLTGIALALVALVAAEQQAHFYDHFDVMGGSARVRLLAASFLVVLLVALHASEEGLLSRPLRWLGDHSYSVYLLHPFASFAATSWVSVEKKPELAFALGMALTLLFSALSRYLVEQPAIELGKRLTSREPSPAIEMSGASSSPSYR